MVKRKAEGDPCIEPEFELITPEGTRPADSAISEQGPATQTPTGDEHCGETTGATWTQPRPGLTKGRN